MVLNPSYETIDGATANDAELGRQTQFSMAWAKTVATDEHERHV